jgi:hypothetical protein
MAITRYVWLAAALLLSACASQGYVYDAGGGGHPHPSAALCASWGQRLDTSVDEDACVATPPPAPVAAVSAAPPPPAQRAPVQTASKRPPAAASPRPTRVASNASEGTTYNEVKQSSKTELGGIIVAGDHRCGTMDAMRPYATSNYKLVCEGARCCLLPGFQR